MNLIDVFVIELCRRTIQKWRARSSTGEMHFLRVGRPPSDAVDGGRAGRANPTVDEVLGTDGPVAQAATQPLGVTAVIK